MAVEEITDKGTIFMKNQKKNNKKTAGSKKTKHKKQSKKSGYTAGFNDLVSPTKTKKDPGFVAESKSALKFHGYDLFLGTYLK